MNQQYPNYTQPPQGQPYQSPRPQQAAYTQPYNTQPPYQQPYQPQQQYAQQQYAQPQYVPQNPQQPYTQAPYTQAAGYHAPAQNYAPVYPPSYALNNMPPFVVPDVRKLRKKTGAKAVNRVSMLAMAQLVCSVLWQLPLGFMIGFLGMNLSNEFLYLLLTGALVPLSTALPPFIYLIFKRNEVTDYLRFNRSSFLVAFLCVIAGLGICMAANYPAVAIQEFLGMFGYEQPEGVSSATTTVGGFILELLVVAVLVPILEEFAFRGVIFSALRKYGVGFAIAASSLIFGCMHLDLSSVVFATICGVVFGLVYVITDNLWTTIAIHALNNAISVLTTNIDIFFIEGVGETVNMLLMLIPIVLGAAALVLLLVFFRNKLFTRPETTVLTPQLRAGETAVSIIRAPATWALLTAVLIQTVLSCIDLL